MSAWETRVLDAARGMRAAALRRQTSSEWDARFRDRRKDLIRAALAPDALIGHADDVEALRLAWIAASDRVRRFGALEHGDAEEAAWRAYRDAAWVTVKPERSGR